LDTIVTRSPPLLIPGETVAGFGEAYGVFMNTRPPTPAQATGMMLLGGLIGLLLLRVAERIDRALEQSRQPKGWRRRVA
jgi:hypothetical protein